MGYDVAVKMISLSLVAVVVASPVSGTLRFSCTHSIARIHQITQVLKRLERRNVISVARPSTQRYNYQTQLTNVIVRDKTFGSKSQDDRICSNPQDPIGVFFAFSAGIPFAIFALNCICSFAEYVCVSRACFLAQKNNE